MTIVLKLLLVALIFFLPGMIIWHYWPDLVALFHDTGDRPIQVSQLGSWQTVSVMLYVTGLTLANLVFVVHRFAKAR